MAIQSTYNGGATISTSSVLLLHSKSTARVWFSISNTHASNKVYLGFDEAAVSGEGVTIEPASSFVYSSVDFGENFQGEVYAIASGASTVVTYTELFTDVVTDGQFELSSSSSSSLSSSSSSSSSLSSSSSSSLSSSSSSSLSSSSSSSSSGSSSSSSTLASVTSSSSSKSSSSYSSSSSSS